MFNPTLRQNLLQRETFHFMESSVLFGFLQTVKMTRLMKNGDKVFVRAGLCDRTSLFVSALTAASSNPSTFQASQIFLVDPSFSFTSDDEPDNWSTDAKLKMEVGVGVCDGGTAYKGSAVRESIDVGL